MNLFRDDPLVWRSFGFAVGVIVFGVTSGLATGAKGHVTIVLPLTASRSLRPHIWSAHCRRARSTPWSWPRPPRPDDARAGGHRRLLSARRTARDQSDSSPAATDRRRTVLWPGTFVVIQQFDAHHLIEAASAADSQVVFRVRVGEALHQGSALADLHGGDLSDRVVQRAVVPGIDRSFAQDPLFALRLLADIALRALSPAVNDPATAVDVLDAVENLLRTLGNRALRTTPFTDQHGIPRVRLSLPDGKTSCAPGSRICCRWRPRHRWCGGAFW